MELNLEYIIKNKIEVEKEKPCVYFLIKNNEIVYVGQTVKLHNRLQQHKLDKDFDSYFFLECKKEELLALERKYIFEFLPVLNGKLPVYLKNFFTKSEVTTIKNEEYRKILEENNIPFEIFGRQTQVENKYFEKTKSIFKELKIKNSYFY